MKDIITVENVSYTYMPKTPYEVTALKDISLAVKEGEIIGIIGPTGCGKSTLIQHFNALLKPTSGKVTVDGSVTSDKSTTVRSLCSKVGLVFQYPEYQLFEETVFKDVAFGPSKIGFAREELYKNVKDAITVMGFDFDRIKTRSPFSLSGGEMRRIAIAGILAMKPSVLVLDEPTAGLDASTRTSFFATLRMLNSNGVTIIIVSHSMDEIVELADRIIVMSEGRVVALGTLKEVFSNAEVISDAGLIFPQCTRLLVNLKEEGFEVDTGLHRIEETTEELIKLKYKVKRK